MRKSLGMQKFVTTLARRHGFALEGHEAISQVQGKLILEREGFGTITVEVPEPNVVRVSDYNDYSDEEILDVELNQPFVSSDFFTGDAEWIMIRSESLLEYMPLIFAQPDEDHTAVIETGSPEEQERIANEIEVQVAKWESEGWLEQASGRIGKAA